MKPARVWLSYLSGLIFFGGGISLGLVTSGLFSSVLAQPITPAADNTGTVVNVDGNQFNIQGGSLSADGHNLFHSFHKFGLDTNQIANFINSPNAVNILGRIIGGSPSVINGLIQITGGRANLYLINPAGIIFGANAQLNINGDFLATTATGIGFDDNSWFEALGNNEYTNLIGAPTLFAFDFAQPGAIINAGDLTVTTGNSITLLGGNVVNTGTVTAPEGTINITAIPGSSKVKISQPGQLLSIEIEPPRDIQGKVLPIEILDLPNLLTGAGLETGLSVNNDGEVKLTGNSTNLPSESGTAIVSGNLNTSSNNSGGEILVFGDRVGIMDGNLNASGTNGGGRVLIGGDYKGQGKVPNADVIYIDPNSIIKADANLAGDGGRIIAWSEQTSRIYGSLSAKGGINSGDGGFVETSSKGHLDIVGSPNISAIAGMGGTWLVDPRNIDIVAGNDDASVGFGGIPIDAPFNASSDNSQLTVGDLIAALQGGSSVLVTTGTTGNQDGNITLNTDFDFDGIGNGSLTLEAAGDILIDTNGRIFDSNPGNDSLNLFLTANTGSNNSDSITVQGSIATGGGNIDFKVNNTNSPALIIRSSGSIDSGGGTINFEGLSINGQGIVVQGTLASEGGDITFEGRSNNNDGILLRNQITSSGGNIKITGNGRNNDGIQVDGILDAGSGSLTLVGDTRDKLGILVKDSAVLNGSNVSLTGTSDQGSGIGLGDGTSGVVNISSSGGQINFNGTSNGAAGIAVTDQNIIINPGGGAVNFNGTSTSQAGILVESSLNFVNGKANLTGTSGGTSNQLVVSGTIDTGNAEVALTGDTINLNPGTGNPVITGAGKIILQPITASLDLDIGGMGAAEQTFLNNAELSKLGETLGEIIIGRVDSSGTISSLSDLDVNAPITLRSPVGSGSINTTGGIFRSNGKKVNLGAAQTITTGDLVTSIAGGDGGAVILGAGGAITTGKIDTNSNSGRGGKVTINSPDGITVNSLDTQGTIMGGEIDITTQQFFRATGSFSDRNNINASLSSTGGQGGKITIRHGGGVLNTPFVVGDGSVNGTQGAITSGTSTITPVESFNTDHIQGNVAILNGIAPPPPKPPTPPIDNDPINPIDIQPPAKYQPPLAATQLPQLEIDLAVSQLEQSLTSSYEKYFDVKSSETFSLEKAKTSLRGIEKATGKKPAFIYVVFSSTAESLATKAQSKSLAKQKEQLELILITSSGQTIRRTIPGAVRSFVLRRVKQLQREVITPSRGDAYKGSGKLFYQWLITPLEAELQKEGIDNLVFILDEGLRSLPLATLNDGSRFLIEDYSVGLMPSLSLTDTNHVDIRNMEVVAMGAGDFDKRQSLPAVPLELSLITQKIWRGDSYLNEEFTLKKLKSARSAKPFGIVHLATHGEFRAGKPTNSYLQLWDNKLPLNAISKLGWNSPPVELLVLSACRTALGDADAELGFTGLAVQAGVKSAVGSLWSVSDEGALALMTRFYEHLKTAPIKSEAMQKAQLDIIQGRVYIRDGKLITPEREIPLPQELARLGDQDLTHPYYWSAFTMVGNPW